MDDFNGNQQNGTENMDKSEQYDKSGDFIFEEKYSEPMNAREQDFYQRLRGRMRSWAESEEGRKYRWTEYLMMAPDLFHLLCRLTIDPDVLFTDKLKLGAAIAYFISPFDIIPEVILGPIGYADDIVIAAYVLNSIVNNTSPEVVSRNWAGEGEILELSQKLLHKADEMIGAGTWQNIKAMFGKGFKK